MHFAALTIKREEKVMFFTVIRPNWRTFATCEAVGKREKLFKDDFEWQLSFLCI